MTKKYCPSCEDLVETRVTSTIDKQIPYQNSIIKRRKIIHRIEDGGCGHTWFTYEVTEGLMRRMAPIIFDDVLEV